MGLRFAMAKATGNALTWGLRNVAHRPAGNMPGKIALYVDPALIAHLAPRLRKGSIVVVGTNGKTTVTNLLADAIEASGQTVVCNRGGANLDSGVATTMLQGGVADWGVFESDELWLARILPHLQAKYVVLLNLFRDQEDRMGGIERIQESIVGTLAASPNTTLIYTADDPRCAAIAAAAPNPCVAVGVGESMDLAQLGAFEEVLCHSCGSVLSYGVRQYDHLGAYKCPTCGFARPELDFAAKGVAFDAAGLRFAVEAMKGEGALSFGDAPRVSYGAAAPYLVYNLLAAFVAARAAGVSPADFQRAADAFDPRNGRLQRYVVDGRPVLLNLAKNPTGFNENLRLVLADPEPKAVAFFVNDKEGDGRDVSWLKDVDFEALSACGCPVIAFAGGLRKDAVRERLLAAGLDAQPVESVAEVFAALRESDLPAGVGVYAIANYTALPEVKAVLDTL